MPSTLAAPVMPSEASAIECNEGRIRAKPGYDLPVGVGGPPTSSHMSSQPLRYAWRSLRRTPVFTITASLTLVIGIAASVAIFAVVNGVLLRPLPYGQPDRLVGAWFDMPPLNLHHAQQTQTTYYTFQRVAHTIE